MNEGQVQVRWGAEDGGWGGVPGWVGGVGGGGTCLCPSLQRDEHRGFFFFFRVAHETNNN